ncbi:reverse transcriptase domain-containing protein [Tanacetum coccineum]
MANSQLPEGEAQGAESKGVGTGSPERPSELAPLAQANPSPTFIKENIDVLRTMIKENDQQTKAKATPKKLAYDESEEGGSSSLGAKGQSERLSCKSSSTSETSNKTRSTRKRQRSLSHGRTLSQSRRSERLQSKSRSKEKTKGVRTKSGRRTLKHQDTSSDSESEDDSKRSREDLSTPYKRPKPTLNHHKDYSFQAPLEGQAPKKHQSMFRQTLGGGAQNWFDYLDPMSVDSFEELSQKYLEEFSQQKRCTSSAAYLGLHAWPRADVLLKSQQENGIPHRGRSILFHPYAERTKELHNNPIKNDGKSHGRSKGVECKNVLRGDSYQEQEWAGPNPRRSENTKQYEESEHKSGSKQMYIQNVRREVPGIHSNEGGNKGRPEKSTSSNEKPNYKEPRRYEACLLEGPGWTNEAEEAFQKIMKRLSKLETLTIPKEGEVLMGMESRYTPTEKMVLALIYTARSLRTIFQKHKQKGQVMHVLDNNGEGTSKSSKKLQKESGPTPRAWRLYLGREINKEGSGVGIILVSPNKETYSYAIRLNFHASEESMDYEALLAGLVASSGKGMKDLHVFVDSEVLVGQMKGGRVLRTWEAKQHMKEAMNATTSFHRFQITYLPKVLNMKAKELN